MGVNANARETPPGESSGLRWSAGIDWVTYIDRARFAKERLHALAVQIAQDHTDPAAKEKPFNLCGYDGWQTPAVRIGHRGASSLLQLSGAVADSQWIQLASCGGQPTRLDVQVTLRPSNAQPRFGFRFLRSPSGGPTARRSSLPRSGLRTESDGSVLGTVGRRTSTRYLRVYDKGVESKTAPPGAIWRCEVEAKQGLAQRLWRDLQTAQDRSQWAYDTVAEQWKRSGYSWPLTGSSRGREGLIALSAPPTDTERLKRWLQVSVAPAVQRLQRSISAREIAQLLQLEVSTDAIP